MITKFLVENGIDDCIKWVSLLDENQSKFVFEFNNEEDALAFKLSWL